MKKTLLTLCLLPLTFTAAHAASNLTGCAAKKQQIETQISFARQHNNTHQVAGLEKALREVDQNCTEGSLLKQRQEKVAEKKLKVREREQELAKAKAERRSASKIQKREDKLEEAHEELNEAEQAMRQ
ncbi:hypothetical protein CRM79_02225 [Pantoea agglomerans]|uniref:DUF1090 domain-containing protein n=1 Tax=Pantoea vagans TaxID=470934 RepID=UPI000BEF1ACB|nr:MULTISPECIES: DUF1090 domain-containing protein [Pantoea]MDE8557756.1 DUF1090 domain-containing protein [Pantoea vagans]MDE8577324.1 DUF1090 domain-containing protein [Pantoea vagans]PEI06083.1 hypothetical protein CRM79_02225 [Pantoea agglomerans]